MEYGRSTNDQERAQRSALPASSPMDVLAEMDRLAASGAIERYRPLPTGFDALDEALGGGLRAGDLVLVGGRQGVGKTTLMMQIARNLAHAGVATCLYVCYEHDTAYLTARLLCLESARPEQGGFDNAASLREVDKLVEAAAASAAPLAKKVLTDVRLWPAFLRLNEYSHRLRLVKGSRATTLSAIGEIIERLGVPPQERLALCVDYLQKTPLADDAAESDRYRRVVEGLKELALQHQMPVLAVTSTDLDGLRARRLQSHHLAGGSALAYEADTILLLSEKAERVSRVHITYTPQKIEEFRRWVICTLEKSRSSQHGVHLEFQKWFRYCCFDPKGRVVTEKLGDERIHEE
ncbi:MAG: AAA family ATPase [Chloroflexi bacterium]|nr:AAA family ATPase [Chloroflexota bacterium]